MLLFIIWKKLAARKNAPHLSKLPNCISTFILFQSSISQKLQIKMILFYKYLPKNNGRFHKNWFFRKFWHKKLAKLLFCPLVFSTYTEFSINSILKNIFLSLKIISIFNIVNAIIISCRRVLSKLNWMISSWSCVQISLRSDRNEIFIRI